MFKQWTQTPGFVAFPPIVHHKSTASYRGWSKQIIKLLLGYFYDSANLNLTYAIGLDIMVKLVAGHAVFCHCLLHGVGVRLIDGNTFGFVECHFEYLASHPTFFLGIRSFDTRL